MSDLAVRHGSIRGSTRFEQLAARILAATAILETAPSAQNPPVQLGPDLRDDIPLMIQIEELLINDVIGSLGGKFRSLQFPANVRVLSPHIASTPRRPEFSTRLLHCDAWSGHPSDSHNLLLYVYTEAGCPVLRIFEPLPSNHELRNFQGSYADVGLTEDDLSEVSIPAEPGRFVAWPTFSPHQTHFPFDDGRNAWRISIDVRLRVTTPYAPDQNHDLAEFSKSKMGHAGLFWMIPNQPFATFQEKVEFELDEASKLGGWAFDLRKEYLRNYYPQFTAP